MNGYLGLEGRRAVVTGAACGIGKAVARMLAQVGCEVVLADVDQDALGPTESELALEGGKVSSWPLDVTDGDAVRRLFESLEDNGGADLLVNNAGIVTRGRLEDFPDADWERVLSVNLTGVYLCTKHFSRSAIARGQQAAIVNVASMSYKGMTQQVAYASSKGGVVSLTRSAAMELGKHGIRVNCVAPGMTETRLVEAPEGEADPLRERMTPQIPLRRFAQPHEIAHPIVFLLSDGASYLTGDTMHISGGARI